jgi:hypothetical protein
MAHEFLSYRRLDRFYHRATLRFSVEADSNGMKYSGSGSRVDMQRQRPFLALSMLGDLFLVGQPCRLVGQFVAIARGLVDDDFVECVFDENYSHLVPTPPAPLIGVYTG